MSLSKTIISLDDGYIYYPKLTKICRQVTAVIFMCNLLRWTGKQRDPEGWIYKTQAEIEEETGLSRREQETARKTLKALGFLEEKYKGIPRKLYYRLNLEAIDKAWNEYIGNNDDNNDPNDSPRGKNEGNEIEEDTVHTEDIALEEPADSVKSIMAETDIITCTNCTCRDVGNVQTNTYNNNNINSVCVNTANEQQKMGNKVYTELDDKLISKLVKHEIALNIIEQILNTDDEKKKNLLKVIESQYFQSKVLNKTAFLISCIRNNWSFADIANSKDSSKDSFKNSFKNSSKNITKNLLVEERDPSIYLEMEKLYKQYIREGAENINENIDVKSLFSSM